MFYGVISVYYNIFTWLENDGFLNLDIPMHINLLHLLFIPKLRESLKVFMDAWNCHPISSEHNFTPRQLMLLHLPPPELDLELTQVK